MSEKEAVVMNVGAYGESLFVRPNENGFVVVWETTGGNRNEIKLTRGHTEVLSQVLTDMLTDSERALERWG